MEFPKTQFLIFIKDIIDSVPVDNLYLFAVNTLVIVGRGDAG
jgi:hypothetical protein